MSNFVAFLSLFVASTSAAILHEGIIHNNYIHDNPGQKYEFGYEIKDPLHGTSSFRQESGVDHGHGSNTKIGSYGLQDSDGRWRLVKYIADDHGFRAAIETNEPGTGNSDPASVIVNGPDNHGAAPLKVSSGGPNYHNDHGPENYGHGHGHGHDHGHGDGYGHGHGHGHGHLQGHGHGLDGIIPAGVPLGPPVLGIPLIDNFKSKSSASSKSHSYAIKRSSSSSSETPLASGTEKATTVVTERRTKE